MIKYFYLILFMILQRSCFSQWELIYENDDVGCLRDMVFTNSIDGFIVGGQKHIITTTNAGATWDIDSTYNGSDFRIIDFIDQDTGLICCHPFSGDGNVLITHDGGASWYAPTLDNSVNFADMELVPEGNVIYAAITGSFGYSFISEDYYSNNIWSTIVDPAVNIWTITFLNADTGYLTGEFISDIAEVTIYKTFDGGYSWYTNENMYGPLYSITFPSDSVGYGLGYESRVWKTKDFGESWSMLPYDFGGYEYYDLDLGISGIYFFNDTIGYIKATYNDLGKVDILRTNDGGNSWYPTSINDPNFNDMGQFVCTGFDTCYAISCYKIYKTTNGGGIDTTTSVINENHHSDFNISPNPATDYIKLYFLKNIHLENIYSYNLYGQVVSVEFNESGIADITNLNSGIYFTLISTSTGTQVKKWIKK